MIVTFNELGGLGGIGNQLFQAMAVLGYAEKHGNAPVLPEIDILKYFQWPYYLTVGNVEAERYYEPTFHFTEIPKFKEVDLYGYFQSARYFPNEFDLQFRTELIEAIPDLYNCVGVHVRRGDYLKLSGYHTNLSVDYYRQAFKEFEGMKFLIFSDDPNWCEENLPEGIVIKGNTPIKDLYWMSKCKCHIIANSTFSWWGAWLAKSEKVIGPKNWFGPKANHNIKDLIPGEWQLI